MDGSQESYRRTSPEYVQSVGGNIVTKFVVAHRRIKHRYPSGVGTPNGNTLTNCMPESYIPIEAVLKTRIVVL